MRKRTRNRLIAGAALVAAAGLMYHNWGRVESMLERLQSRKCPPPVEAPSCKEGASCHTLPVKGDEVCDTLHGEDRPESKAFSKADCGFCGDGIAQRRSSRASPPHEEHGVMVQYVAGGRFEDERSCEADLLCGNGLIDKPRLVSMHVPAGLGSEGSDGLLERPVLIYERCNGNKEEPWSLQYNPNRLIRYELVSYCKADCEPEVSEASGGGSGARGDGDAASAEGKDAGPVEDPHASRKELLTCPSSMSGSASASPLNNNIHMLVRAKNDVLWYTLASPDTRLVKIGADISIDSGGRVEDISLFATCDGKRCGEEGKLWQILSRYRTSVLGREIDSAGTSCRLLVMSPLVRPKAPGQ